MGSFRSLNNSRRWWTWVVTTFVLVVSSTICNIAEAQQAGVGTRAANTPTTPVWRASVRFREREFDLVPYYEGFPFSRYRASYVAGRLLYQRDQDNVRNLLSVALPPPGTTASNLELASGTRMGTDNWNLRNLRDVQFDRIGNRWIVLADDANEERYNLFVLPRDGGTLERITNVPYVFGFGIDDGPEGSGELVYVARYGSTVPYRSCVEVLPRGATASQTLRCDDPTRTFTWTDVRYTPDRQALIVKVLEGTDRNRENLLYIPRAGGEPRVLTTLGQRRRHLYPLKEWPSPQRMIYLSDESGFTNLHTLDLHGGVSTQLTRFREDLDTAVPIIQNGTYRILAVAKRPFESEVFLLDANSGEILARRVVPETLSDLDYEGNRVLMVASSRATLFRLEEWSVSDPPELRPRVLAYVPDATLNRIQQCNTTRVEFPTFDQDPNTGRRRMLHAFLQRPTFPPPPNERRLAVIEAFYGGENRFDMQAQIFCTAGITVLSPAVRGSTGFGADFAALNDHDLGGNEVFDLVHAARWLALQEGIPEGNIGLFGASHGGYEVQRALTMPNDVNGRTERFGWGFGLSWFGFSDILSFYQRSNIPDWVLLEAGDPRTEQQRLRDRSPITHVRLAQAPLLLLHGERDNRVSVEESRAMYRAMRQARRPVQYVEIPGQGHGLKGLDNARTVWRSVFGFLEQKVLHPPRVVRQAPIRTRRAHWRWALLGVLVVGLGLASRQQD